MEVRNDTPVYHVLDGGPWSGTREAICAKGLEIDPHWQCRGYCPHQWLGQDGFIDPELTRKYPLTRKPRPASVRSAGLHIPRETRPVPQAEVPDMRG